MHTTLDIADDVLQAVKERARRENRTTGEIISELVRLALSTPAPDPASTRKLEAVHGFKPFAPRGNVVTNDIVDCLRHADAY